ncbi:MAG: RloB domain-containing protein [Thermoplasmata archaeon]|nr:RloB domain-containing protein [Thermoplasmata archaeon]
MNRRGYSRRKERNRRPRNRLIIVCEGQKTEVNYFKGFRTRYSNVEIIPMHGRCTDPKSIVKFAKEQIEKYDIDFKEGDGVWCAFDVDENSNDALKSAVELAEKTRKGKIRIALSNPSFEIWFLLHYRFNTSSRTRREALDEVKKFIPDYAKNKEVYSIVEDKLETAISNAKKLNVMHDKNNVDYYSRESNPSSQVFQLIEFIRELTEKNISN